MKTRRSFSSRSGRSRSRLPLAALFAVATFGAASAAWAEEVDLLTFAAGALPIAVSGSGAAIGTSFEHAIQLIDGDPTARTLHRRAAADDTDFVFVYALPASTTFERFLVPNVVETPSPNQTFAHRIEVAGSSVGPDGPFAILANGELTPHTAADEVTDLMIVATPAPVRWVRVRLSETNEAGANFREFSEIVGYGRQESVPMSTGFTGVWSPRGGTVELNQVGAVVSGCIDGGRKALTGTVTGSLLRATFVDNTSGTRGALIATVLPSGGLWGLRSDNGAPFRLLEADVAAARTAVVCTQAEAPTLGCGAVVHGIQFAFDSADLLPESDAVLEALTAGLRADSSTRIVIEGHTSSEGAEDYNQALSNRRAQSVVNALVARGLDGSRLVALGRGEQEPIAGNDTEAGRSLNRRVEIDCAAP